jgi:hypothetical protein
MVEFSGGAVIAMLALVESTVVALWARLGAKKADEDDLDQVEETADEALKAARTVKRDVARVERQVDARTDGGPKDD